MIGSTTENLAGILKVQYLKVRKNNKYHNFVLIQIKFRNIYLLIEQEEINRFLKLKKMSSVISMCKNSSFKISAWNIIFQKILSAYIAVAQMIQQFAKRQGNYYYLSAK